MVAFSGFFYINRLCQRKCMKKYQILSNNAEKNIKKSKIMLGGSCSSRFCLPFKGFLLHSSMRGGSVNPIFMPSAILSGLVQGVIIVGVRRDVL